MPILPRLCLLTGLLVLAFPAPAAAQTSAPPSGTRLDGVAAVVGEQIVLHSEVGALAQQAATAQQAPVTDDLWSRALDQIVDRRVIIDHARRDTTVIVTEAQVNAELDRNIGQLTAQVGSVEALEAAYGRPLDLIRTSLREDVRDELLLQQYRGRRMRSLAVTPGEVRAWFSRIPQDQIPLVPELVRVAHIVARAAPSEEARLRERAFVQALRDSVAAGQATLGELADRHSQDPGNRNRDGSRNGGAYRDFSLRDLDPTFAAATAALEPGGVSQVFETPFGFHVVRLDERVGERVSFAHVLRTVPVGAAEIEAARARLNTLRDSVLTHNVPFEAIARRHSEDPFSASRGGFVADPRTGERDLRLEALGPLWTDTVGRMQVGETSPPAPAQLLDGTDVLHVVRLQRRTPTHRLSLADDYALLADYALQEKRQTSMREWVDRLRTTTYVDIRASDRYVPATPETSAG